MSEVRATITRLGLTIYLAGCVLGAACLLIGIGTVLLAGTGLIPGVKAKLNGR